VATAELDSHAAGVVDLPCDDEVRAAVGARPAAVRELDLHVVLSCGESWSKARRTIEAIANDLGSRHLLTVACGEEDPEPPPVLPQVEFRLFPGHNVFMLRALLPEIARDAMWVALLEDHVVPLPGWIAGLSRAMAEMDDDVLTFTGSATNQVSTSAWDYASYLFNFAYHWHPSAAAELPGTVATAVFRRDLLGHKRLARDRFEMTILPRRGPVHNGFPVDHVQFKGALFALAHSFDNGLASGGAFRDHAPDKWKAARQLTDWVMGERYREIASLIRAHPNHNKLPSGTLWRLRMVGWAHAAGTLAGTMFGAGRAHFRLE
jgi:hypothetical protein